MDQRNGSAESSREFTVLEESKDSLDVADNSGSFSDKELSRGSSFENENTYHQEEVVESHSIPRRQATSNSLDELDRCGSSFASGGRLPISKSEANLQERKILEVARKNVSSAPVTKDTLEQLNNNGNYESDTSLSKPSLPG